MNRHINRTTEFIVRALTEGEAVSKPLRAPGKGAKGAPQIEDGKAAAAATAKAAATQDKPVAPKAKAPVKVVARPRTNGAGRALA